MKRTLAVGVSLVALLALPAAAQAYPAPPVTVGVSDPSPAVGDTVAVASDNLDGATSATLTVTSIPASIPDAAITIAGTASLTKPVTDGAVSFAFSASQDGIYNAKVTTDNGIDVPLQVITVGDPQIGGTGSGSGSGSGSTGGSASTGGLANTGASVGGLAALAGGLLVVGAGGTYLVKRGSRSNA